MNLQKLEQRLLDRKSELQATREGPYGYLKVGATYERDVERLNALLEKLRPKLASQYMQARQEQHQRVVDHARRLWERGNRFMSLDAERTYGDEIVQVGVTIFKGNEFETYNYDLDEPRIRVPFAFGKSMTVNRMQLQRLLMSHLNSVDSVVGHSLRHDLKGFNHSGFPLPDFRYFDTANICRTKYGYSWKLGDLAKYYKIEARAPHNAGNDSRYGAEVFLKMIHEGSE